MRVSLTHIGHVSLRLQLSEVASYTCSFHNQLMKIDNNKDRTMPTKKILPNSPIIAQMFGPCRKYHISIMLEEQQNQVGKTLRVNNSLRFAILTLKQQLFIKVGGSQGILVKYAWSDFCSQLTLPPTWEYKGYLSLYKNTEIVYVYSYSEMKGLVVTTMVMSIGMEKDWFIIREELENCLLRK